VDAHDHHTMSYVADAVVIDLATNAIRVRVPGLAAEPGVNRPALLDVGANGRLIGVEVGDAWVSVMDLPGEEDPYARSASIEVAISAETPPSITIPRRGPGYEITYPSGNECWQTRSVGGRLIQVCATIDDAPAELPGAPEQRSGRSLRQP
jgi:hypothetical protein